MHCMLIDDSKMNRVINTEEDLSTSQSGIDKISDWCKINKITINTKKCKIMGITLKSQRYLGSITLRVNLWKVLKCIKIYDSLLLVISHEKNKLYIDKITAKLG